jgi:hypothetical protein
MKIISTKIHAVFDYLGSLLFVASPWIFHFEDHATATWIPILIGAMAITMSLFTDYEGGLVKAVRMPTHLNVDIISGLFLAASPWLFGFADDVYAPHLGLGLFELAAGLLTNRHAVEHRPNELG